MTLSILLKAVGVTMLLLSVGHWPIAKHLKWREDSRQLTLINRQILFVHSYFIALILLFMGILLVFYTPLLLLASPLAKLLALGLVIFWASRLFIQLFIYSPANWKGDRFRTVTHVLFTLLWSVYVFAFAWLLWTQYQS